MGAKRYSLSDELTYYRVATAHPSTKNLDAYFLGFLPDPLKAFRHKDVIEIGTGGGLYTRWIVEHFEPRSFVASDLVRYARLDLGNIPFLRADCRTMPFADRSADIVFGSLVLCQIADLLPIVREVRRILRPHGMFVGIEPNPTSILHLCRYYRKPHSPNQYLLGKRRLTEAFQAEGFVINIRRFHHRALLNNALTASLLGIVAEP